MPIITLINKLDREGRDPFDLLDEIEQSLALDVTPASWPIGMGRATFSASGNCSPIPPIATMRSRNRKRSHAQSGGNDVPA